jgi:hypothetical protein
MWEATLENWESEFPQMAAFIVLTTMLVQRRSPESRRPGAIELSMLTRAGLRSTKCPGR